MRERHFNRIKRNIFSAHRFFDYCSGFKIESFKDAYSVLKLHLYSKTKNFKKYISENKKHTPIKLKNLPWMSIFLKRIIKLGCLSIFLLFPLSIWSSKRSVETSSNFRCDHSFQSMKKTRTRPFKKRRSAKKKKSAQNRKPLQNIKSKSTPQEHILNRAQAKPQFSKEAVKRIQAMTVKEVQEIPLEEIRQLNRYSLRVFTLEQLQALNVEQALALGRRQLEALTIWQTLYGLTRKQIHAMGYQKKKALFEQMVTSKQKHLFQLKIISLEELQAKPRAWIQALKPEELRVLDTTEFTPEQIGYLTVNQVEGLIYDGRLLSRNQAKALTFDQLPKRPSEWTQILNAQQMTPHKISQLSSHEIRRLALKDLRDMTHEQLNALDLWQLEAMTFKQKLLGFTRDQIEMLNNWQRKVLIQGDWTHSQRQILKMKTMSLADVQAMSHHKLHVLTSEELQVLRAHELSVKQIQWLSPRLIRSMPLEWLQELTRRQVKSLTREQLQTMTSYQTYMFLTLLLPKQVSYLSVVQVMFMKEELRILNPKQLQALTDDQIKVLNIRALPPRLIRHLTKRQIKSLTYIQVSLLTIEQRQALTSEQKRALSPLQRKVLKRQFPSMEQMQTEIQEYGY